MPKSRTSFKISHSLLVVSALACLAGCAKSTGGPRILPMGERAEVGSLVYNVLESEWFGQLGHGDIARKPKDQYLLLRLNVTNSGSTEAEIPPVVLIDSSGQTHKEEMNGEGVPDWLGMLRKVQPAETQTGRVVFDVPRADYQLRVTDDAFHPEDVKVALIQIPLRFESGTADLPR